MFQVRRLQGMSLVGGSSETGVSVNMVQELQGQLKDIQLQLQEKRHSLTEDNQTDRAQVSKAILFWFLVRYSVCYYQYSKS